MIFILQEDKVKLDESINKGRDQIERSLHDRRQTNNYSSGVYRRSPPPVSRQRRSRTRSKSRDRSNRDRDRDRDRYKGKNLKKKLLKHKNLLIFFHIFYIKSIS